MGVAAIGKVEWSHNLHSSVNTCGPMTVIMCKLPAQLARSVRAGLKCSPGTTLMGSEDGVGQNTAAAPGLLLDSVWPLYCSCVPVKVSCVAPAMLAWSHTITRLLLLQAVLALGCWLPVRRPLRGGGGLLLLGPLKLLEVIIVLKKIVGITLVVLLGVLLLVDDGLSHLSFGVLGGALGVRWGQVLSRLL